MARPADRGAQVGRTRHAVRFFDAAPCGARCRDRQYTRTALHLFRADDQYRWQRGNGDAGREYSQCPRRGGRGNAKNSGTPRTEVHAVDAVEARDAAWPRIPDCFQRQAAASHHGPIGDLPWPRAHFCGYREPPVSRPARETLIAHHRPTMSEEFSIIYLTMPVRPNMALSLIHIS